MDNKSTDDLKQELMSDPDIDSYIRKNESCFVSRSVTELLTEFYETPEYDKITAGPEIQYERSVPASGICRKTEAFQEQDLMHVHRHGAEH